MVCDNARCREGPITALEYLAMRESHRGVCVDAVGPVVEALENRQMLSASLLRGVLKIGGTAGDDVITVGINPANKAQIIVNDGVKTSKFNKTLVKTISILTGDGADDNLTGGAGNDVLGGDSEDTLVFTGQPPSTVIGNDNLNGGDGNDWLLGGTRVYFDTSGGHFSDNGRDTFTGGLGNDIIDKGGTDDTITDKESGDFVPVDDQPRVQEGQPGDVHTHVLLKIRVRQGSKYKNVVVQPDIGFFGTNGPADLSNLHTHDTSGLIHYEAAAGSPAYKMLEF